MTACLFNNFMLDISHTLVYSWHNEQNTANALTRISRRWCSWAANRESASRWTLTTLNPPESVSEKLTGSLNKGGTTGNNARPLSKGRVFLCS